MLSHEMRMGSASKRLRLASAECDHSEAICENYKTTNAQPLKTIITRRPKN